MYEISGEMLLTISMQTWVILDYQRHKYPKLWNS